MSAPTASQATATHRPNGCDCHGLGPLCHACAIAASRAARPAVQAATTIDPATRRTTCTLPAGQTLTCVDWGLSLDPDTHEDAPWPVLVIPGTIHRA